MTDIDTNVTALRPSPAKGEGPSRNALRQRRFRRRRKGVTRDASVTAKIAKQSEADTPFVGQGRLTSSVTRSGTAIDVLAVTAAVTFAGTAAYFSIRGFVVLFPGAPSAIVIMGAAMEGGKLATVAWLARHWHVSTWAVRGVLAVLILTIAAINAAGVYSQLIAAHVGLRGKAASAVETHDAELMARIDVQAHAVADLDRRITQIDAAIEKMTEKGHTTAAMRLADEQRKVRTSLVDKRKREAATLVALQTERATVAANGRQAKTEAMPIQYVAAVFGVTDPEVAIRWLVLFMTVACDPLAIALAAAASARR